MNDSDSDSESEIEMEEKIIRPKNDPPTKKRAEKVVADDEEEDEEEDEEDVPLSDLEGEEERDDMVPHTRLTINNKAALQAALARISIDTSSSAPFATHQSIVSSKPTAEAIPDVSDDLQRELALLSQSLEAARKGRSLLIKEGVPFSRPGDYFAEMAKDDGQMQKVKEKLVEEATAKKAAADARKLRDLKKFGKQVQIAKLQERQKAKKDTLEKISLLKKSKSRNPFLTPFSLAGAIFQLLYLAFLAYSVLTSVQSDRKGRLRTSVPTKEICLTLLWIMRSRAMATRRLVQVEVVMNPMRSVRRRTTSMDSAARSDTPSLEMPLVQATSAASTTGGVLASPRDGSPSPSDQARIGGRLWRANRIVAVLCLSEYPYIAVSSLWQAGCGRALTSATHVGSERIVEVTSCLDWFYADMYDHSHRGTYDCMQVYLPPSDPHSCDNQD